MLNSVMGDKPSFNPKKISNLQKYIENMLMGGFINQANAAETQKARGVFFLQKQSSIVDKKFGWRVPKHLVFEAGKEFSPGSFNFPVFARPCPTIPRHGFVDSVSCKNFHELNAVSNATYLEEPNAELMITKPVSSSYNAIITNGVITFAHGNDGATSGNGCRYFYVSEDPVSKAIDLPKGICLEGEVPFYELVVSKDGKVNLVQCRSAPGLPPSKDFVPHTVNVKTVIKAGGDLLEWEKKLKNVDPFTTAIDHSGGSLASHFSIHAIINKIPIFTTYSPKVGQLIEPTVESPEINDLDRQKFFESFVVGFSSTDHIYDNAKFIKQDPLQISRNILHLSLATLHNFNAINYHKDYALLGVVLGMFVRVCFSVSKGEARFAKNNSCVQNSKMWKDEPKLKKYIGDLPSSRSACYKSLLRSSATQAIEEIPYIYRVFDGVNWGGGYGGSRWAACTRSALNLFNSCVAGNIEKVVEQFNVVINENHNGGKYLNKIINVSDFDTVAKDPSLYTMRHLAQIFEILDFAWQNGEKNDGFKDNYGIFQNINYSDIPEASKTFVPKKSMGYKCGDWIVNTLDVNESSYFGGESTVSFKVSYAHKESPNKIYNTKFKAELPDDAAVHTATASKDGVISLLSTKRWFVDSDGNCIISKRRFKSCFLGAIS